MSVFPPKKLVVLGSELTNGLMRTGVLCDQCAFSECLDMFHEIIVFTECFDFGQKLFLGNVAQGILKSGTEVFSVDIGKALLAWPVSMFDVGGVCAGGRPFARLRALLVRFLDLFVVRHGGQAYVVLWSVYINALLRTRELARKQSFLGGRGHGNRFYGKM